MLRAENFYFADLFAAEAEEGKPLREVPCLKRTGIENGNFIGLVSAYRASDEDSHAFKDSQDGEYLKAYAGALGFGYAKAFGYWIENRGLPEERRRGSEYSFIIYAESGEKDYAEKLLRAFCDKFARAGFMLAYGSRAYYGEGGAPMQDIGGFDGSLKQLEDYYAASYLGRRSFADGSKEGLSFIFESFSDCMPIKKAGGFAAAVGRAASLKHLDSGQGNAFDYIRLRVGQ